MNWETDPKETSWLTKEEVKYTEKQINKQKIIKEKYLQKCKMVSQIGIERKW